MACHLPRVHTNMFLFRCFLCTCCVRRIERGTCFCNLHNEYMCVCGGRGKHTVDPLMIVFSWSMQIMLRVHFQPRDMMVRLWTSLGPRSQHYHCTALQCFCRPGVIGNSTTCLLAFQIGTVQLCWLCKANQHGRNCFHKCSQSAPWRN